MVRKKSMGKILRFLYGQFLWSSLPTIKLTKRFIELKNSMKLMLYLENLDGASCVDNKLIYIARITEYLYVHIYVNDNIANS